MDSRFNRHFTPGLVMRSTLVGATYSTGREVTEFFLQAGAWLSNAHVQRSYTSLNYSQVAAHLARISTNVFGQLVAPHPQGEARISLSSNTDITLDMVPYIQARRQAIPRARECAG